MYKIVLTIVLLCVYTMYIIGRSRKSPARNNNMARNVTDD